MSELHKNAEKREQHYKLKKAAENAQTFETRVQKKNNVTPMPSREPGHPKSHAVHLRSGGTSHSKPQGDLRHGLNPGARRQP